ncbi:glycosyltransferase [Butyrivibrio sp. VCD2006]|uniref:glycosyltransferase n=1 Tax=Butyrivibrio sp. VCD2006 TaxID=1280664 RepID=UPI000425843F|nr:glycosyltransferase [Butyrivibrio sp. VCD2006]
MNIDNDIRTVCVMLSAFNGEEYIEQQIESIENQQNVRIVLVIRDDGSEDKTVQLVSKMKKKYQNIELLTGSNLGVIGSFIKLAIYAQNIEADYFAFSDQDDIWSNEKLYSATKWLEIENNIRPNIYFCNLLQIDSEMNPLGKVYKSDIVISKKGALVRNYAFGCTMVFNPIALELFIKKPNARMWMHDYWLYLIGVFVGNIKYDPVAHIMYRQHESNTIGTKHGIKKTLEIKLKAVRNIGNHQREFMAKDFLDTYADLLSDGDKEIINKFSNYRKNFFCRISCALDKDYRVYSGYQSFFLILRFLIGNV